MSSAFPLEASVLRLRVTCRIRWRCLWYLSLLLCQLWATDLRAQSGAEPLAGAEETDAASVMDVPQTQAVSSLGTIQSLIQANLDAQQELRNDVKSSDAASLSDAQQQLDELTTDLKQLRKSLEQAAIGSVDLSVFDETEATFDWHVELSQVLMPIVDNLKALTEKPRKISSLISQIDRLSKQRSAIDSAITHSEYGESLKQVQVELKRAGDSSLDFWIYVTMQRTAISGFFKLERMIQQACVRV